MFGHYRSGRYLDVLLPAAKSTMMTTSAHEMMLSLDQGNNLSMETPDHCQMMCGIAGDGMSGTAGEPVGDDQDTGYLSQEKETSISKTGRESWLHYNVQCCAKFCVPCANHKFSGGFPFASSL